MLAYIADRVWEFSVRGAVLSVFSIDLHVAIMLRYQINQTISRLTGRLLIYGRVGQADRESVSL